MTALSRPQKNLLHRLVSHWPKPCYIIITGRGRHALVTPELTRAPHGFARATTMHLKEAGLITMDARFGEIPTYRYRHSSDTNQGWLVSVTSVGREVLSVQEGEQ